MDGWKFLFGSISPNFVRQAKTRPAYSVRRKIRHSISPTFCHFKSDKNCAEIRQNLFSVRQICLPFTKCYAPKKASHLVCANKCWWNRPFEQKKAWLTLSGVGKMKQCKNERENKEWSRVTEWRLDLESEISEFIVIELFTFSSKKIQQSPIPTQVKVNPKPILSDLSMDWTIL